MNQTSLFTQASSVTPRSILFILFLLSYSFGQAQQVTEVVTDFAGYWKSDTAAANSTLPNTSHNVLAFKYKNIRYSTGVNNTTLTNNSLAFTNADFRAFPVGAVGGTILSGASTYIALASSYDGVPAGYSTPYPYLKIKDVLIDGIHGLDLGTGATNVPASALINFPVTSITPTAIVDSTPDILVSQIATPSTNGDTLYFVNSTGDLVGSKIAINWTSYKLLGTYSLDLYTLPVNALCDTAHISGNFSTSGTRDIRLIAFRLSEFGITAGNATDITNFVLKASGTSDPAFIAYNSGSFQIPAPVITGQPSSLIVCPATSGTASFTVNATGTNLNYQWKKNNIDIVGATDSTYSISNVTTSNTGSYSVVVSNTAGSVASNTAYLNIAIAIQPLPAAQSIATGTNCTLTVSANNATSYQWKKAGVDIPGATTASYTISPVTSTTAASYTVQVINSAGSGCANVLSNAVTVTGKTTLYSKPSVNLNLPGSWGVATDGSGSSPVDFSRTEHTFIVKNDAITGGDLTIAGTLDVSNAVITITPASTLSTVTLTRSGTGSLAGSATSNLTLNGTSTLFFQAGKDLLKNLIVNTGSINLISPLNITGGSGSGTMTLNGGSFATNGNLTFKSDSLGTGRLDKLTGGATITGAATVERWISPRKAWRLLAVPTNTTQSIKQTWQEGGTGNNSNPVAKYGIQITSPRTTWAADGFDLYSAAGPSMKSYDPATNTYIGVTSTANNIKSSSGYLVFIRGDRSSNAYNSPVTSTTLRTKGSLYTYNQPPVAIAANMFGSIGNPYPSAIDMRFITKTGLKDFFYLWDPKLGGVYGLGAYQTFSKNTDDDYVVTPGGGSYGFSGSVQNTIPSGLAFMVQGGAGGGSLTITENSKAGVGPSARAGDAPQPQLRANLYGLAADGSSYMADGLLVNYSDSFENSVDDMDALKSVNSSENLSIKNDTDLLIIERRKIISSQDTLQLNLTNLKAQGYRFNFSAEAFNPGMTAFLEDKYLQTSSPLNLYGSTDADFTIVNVPGSYAADRFRVVFKQLVVLPVSFTSIKAYVQGDQNIVDWKIENEVNIKYYEVERSADGIHFTKIAQAAAIAGGRTGAYSITDAAPLKGTNFYRVKSIGNTGTSTYSVIVRVDAASKNPVISVYPNPVVNNIISIQFNNISKGEYSVQLVNKAGQVLLTKKLSLTQGSTNQAIQIPRFVPKGIYQLDILKPNGDHEGIEIII